MPSLSSSSSSSSQSRTELFLSEVHVVLVVTWTNSISSGQGVTSFLDFTLKWFISFAPQDDILSIKTTCYNTYAMIHDGIMLYKLTCFMLSSRRASPIRATVDFILVITLSSSARSTSRVSRGALPSLLFEDSTLTTSNVTPHFDRMPCTEMCHKLIIYNNYCIAFYYEYIVHIHIYIYSLLLL